MVARTLLIVKLYVRCLSCYFLMLLLTACSYSCLFIHIFRNILMADRSIVRPRTYRRTRNIFQSYIIVESGFESMTFRFWTVPKSMRLRPHRVVSLHIIVESGFESMTFRFWQSQNLCALDRTVSCPCTSLLNRDSNPWLSVFDSPRIYAP